MQEDSRWTASASGPDTGRPPVRAERGMVAAPHALAAEAGVNILRRGGSAVDAAIATNAVLCVAYPHMAGLGGDACLLLHSPGGMVEAINASGPAAAAVDRARLREEGHESIPERGVLSALTVPGAVDGWRLAHERHGQLEWRELFDDAIHLARRGVAVARSLARWYPANQALLAQTRATATLHLPGGRPPREGAPTRNEDLARSFETLARDGARNGFYEGELADRICAGIDGTILAPSDFARYTASWVEPICSDYRGLAIHELPANTQGFTVLQALNLLEGYDVAGWGDLSVDYVHHAAEAIKLAFADRDAWLTDPEFHNVPIAEMIRKDYAARRRALIDADASLTMGEVPSGIDGGWSGVRARTKGGTCYMATVDSSGLMVSLIESIYLEFGSGVVAEGTGILMQNRGSSFSLADGHPNRLEPGKRTSHTLIPALALDRDGAPYLAFGAMGGEGQPQTHLALITRLCDFGYDVQQAIEAPRWLMGTTLETDGQALWLEARFADPLIRELERRGQPVRVLPSWDDNVGHAQAIRRHPDGFLEGGADPRGDGAAIGY